MKRIKQLVILIYVFILLMSCNSNSLKQVNAEKTIKEFLSRNSIKTSSLEVSPSTIREIEKTNIYSQYYTSVKVNFNSKDNNVFTLLFDFKRTPDNQWFLKSVEGVNATTEELSTWFTTKKNLNIQAQ